MKLRRFTAIPESAIIISRATVRIANTTAVSPALNEAAGCSRTITVRLFRARFAIRSVRKAFAHDPTQHPRIEHRAINKLEPLPCVAESEPRLRMKGKKMTPKEQYEARKVERNKLKDLDHEVRQKTESLMMFDMLDRFVTAAERIADAMERPHSLA